MRCDDVINSNLLWIKNKMELVLGGKGEIQFLLMWEKENFKFICAVREQKLERERGEKPWEEERKKEEKERGKIFNL